MLPWRWAAAAEGKRKQKVLFFTRSAGFEHSAIKRDGAKLGHAEQVLIELGQRPRALKSSAPRTGRVFDGDLGKYDLSPSTLRAICHRNAQRPWQPHVGGRQEEAAGRGRRGQGVRRSMPRTDSFRSGASIRTSP